MRHLHTNKMHPKSVSERYIKFILKTKPQSINGLNMQNEKPQMRSWIKQFLFFPCIERNTNIGGQDTYILMQHKRSCRQPINCSLSHTHHYQLIKHTQINMYKIKKLKLTSQLKHTSSSSLSMFLSCSLASYDTEKPSMLPYQVPFQRAGWHHHNQRAKIYETK